MLLIAQLFNVRTDAADWPVDLPEGERPILTDAVRAVIGLDGILSTMELDRILDSRLSAAQCPTFLRAALWDFRFACIARACRAANLSERWTHGDHAHRARAARCNCGAEGRPMLPDPHGGADVCPVCWRP